MKKHAWRNNKEAIGEQKSMQDNVSCQNEGKRKILYLREEIVKNTVVTIKETKQFGGNKNCFECG